MLDERYREMLGTHLGFIKQSAQNFNSGNIDEGLRLAVELRVLFHQTKQSTALVSASNPLHHSIALPIA